MSLYFSLLSYSFTLLHNQTLMLNNKKKWGPKKKKELKISSDNYYIFYLLESSRYLLKSFHLMLEIPTTDGELAPPQGGTTRSRGEEDFRDTEVCYVI